MTTATSTQMVSARIAQRLAETLGPRRYRMWFDRSARLDYADDRRRLQVTVPNQFVADWIDKHFREDLRLAAQQELGDAVELEVQVKQDLFAVAAPPPGGGISAGAPADSCGSSAMAPAVSAPSAAMGGRRCALKHSLDSFIVGPTNELAYAAALRVVDSDHTVTTPLCIHGGCGLGKTHLLQGVCAKIFQLRHNARVLYTTGEQFTNEFLAAMRANKVETFRKRLRELDLLAVDDVHFLANKQATQQEFLHTFDTIDLGGARVVLASDCHPKLIKQFTEALVSRCVRGLVIEIRSPDEVTRAKIIQALAQRRGLQLMDGVAQELARRSAGSVRDLEGAIAKLHALAALSCHRRDLGSAEADNELGLLPVGHAVLNQFLQDEPLPVWGRSVSLETIIQAITRTLGMSRGQVLGRSRHRHAVLARSLLVYVARQRTTLSFPEIAAAMERCTHSTVVTAAHRVKKQLAANQVVTTPAHTQAVPIGDLLRQVEQALVG